MSAISVEKIFRRRGSMFTIQDVDDNHEILPPGIYVLKLDPRIMVTYLDRIQDCFTFGHKIYSNDFDFIQRVVKTNDAISENMGVLLTGIKGTGKTITAQLLANAYGYPVIILSEDLAEHAVNFISQINQNVTILVDEYEKVYEDRASLLTVMDGVLKSNYKRNFILTTNTTHIESNLLCRPGRLRYKRNYSEILDIRVVREIIDDLLKRPEYRDELVEVIQGLSMSTIDIIKVFVEEINIHDKSPKELLEDMNIVMEEKYDIEFFYDDSTDGSVKLRMNYMEEERDYSVDDAFSVQGRTLGTIVEMTDNVITVALNRNRTYTGIHDLDEDLTPRDVNTVPYKDTGLSKKEKVIDVLMIKKRLYNYALVF